MLRIFIHIVEIVVGEMNSSKSPNYNDTIFWSKKNIEYIVKKYRKNLIPKIRNTFIYDKESVFFFIGLNKFTTQIKRQRQGVYLDFQDKEKFYYFPYNKKEKLILNCKEENYDQLLISFTNKLGNIVCVEYKYGKDLSYSQFVIKKKYQYVNKDWVEIKEEDE